MYSRAVKKRLCNGASTTTIYRGNQETSLDVATRVNPEPYQYGALIGCVRSIACASDVPLNEPFSLQHSGRVRPLPSQSMPSAHHHRLTSHHDSEGPTCGSPSTLLQQHLLNQRAKCRWVSLQSIEHTPQPLPPLWQMGEGDSLQALRHGTPAQARQGKLHGSPETGSPCCRRDHARRHRY